MRAPNAGTDSIFLQRKRNLIFGITVYHGNTYFCYGEEKMHTSILSDIIFSEDNKKIFNASRH